MTTDSNFKHIANDSGFPLQIALQQSVKTGTNMHQWNVHRAEHAWNNPADGKSGFIDLVVSRKDICVSLVIECKRVKESTWVFMNSNGKSDDQQKAFRSWVSCYRNRTFTAFDWFDVNPNISMPEAHFCAIRGQGTNDKNTLLERVAADLVSSTEALALEERDYRRENFDSVSMYFNVLVTTAELVVTEFDPSDIALKDGTINEAKFRDVSYLQVRKQFSVRPIRLTAQDWEISNQPCNHRENTVIVVRADYFEKFLGNFYVPIENHHRFLR